MNDRRWHVSPFPGRAAVLRALREAGTWNTREMYRWALSNGGTNACFEALAWYVRKGRVTYTTNRWEFVR